MRPKTKLIIFLIVVVIILIKFPQARATLSHLAGKAASSASRHTGQSLSFAAMPDGGGAPSGNAALGRRMAAQAGWTGAQWGCLDALWNRESGWKSRVWNYQGSGAYGIPQALPAGKMASAGGDWQTNPATQIRWGLGYIRDRYGSPCGAWNHETADNWY